MADTKHPKSERLFPSSPAARERFRQANPDAFGRTDGNVDAVRRLAVVETRVAAIKERLRAHVARHEKMWVADEAGRVLNQHVAKAQHPMPKEAKQNLGEAVTRQAQRNVQARVAKRFTALKATKARLMNAINNTNPKQDKAPKQESKQSLRQAFKRSNQPKM